ncbi:phosphate ABC transporter substrate-binding protein, PhoT family [Frankineae bacterium MT45]|nr:phosphate ABC transporter substrate-binding protein, PhoT family [Frankineae bacterium MT45]
MRKALLGRGVVAAGVVAGLMLAAAAPGSAASSTALISGTGSSWSANAVNQWVSDVQTSQGLQVVYTAPGSAQGRRDFSSNNNDFAVSDIGYQGHDPKTGADDSSARPYAYLPIVAGGTAFPYQIKVNGKKITNLRLSGLTLAKIFTGQITNWNDDQITKDNNYQALPSKPIIPVVHSEGAGSTAQFTMYLAKEFPTLWTPFNQNASFTEYYPATKTMVAQNGSDGVMNYVTSKAGDGTIGYDEYSYALNANYPVAKILNSAGYYTLPTQYNDAVALTKAQINTNPKSADYLLQNLDQVYTNPDRRTYPLSSYSYAIIPTSPTDTNMTTAKRQTLADYLFYSVCGGQGEMGHLGYSPLPLNLVKASFAQISKLHAADPKVDLSNQAPATCDNPTFDPKNPSKNKLAEIAPQPPLCDKQGQGPCLDGGAKPRAVANGSPSNNGSTGTEAAAHGGTTGGGSGASTTVHAAAGGGGSSNQATTGTGVDTAVDPETGLTTSGDDQTSGDVTANPTTLAGYERAGNELPYAGLAVGLLLILLIAPPLVARRIQANRRGK